VRGRLSGRRSGPHHLRGLIAEVKEVDLLNALIDDVIVLLHEVPVQDQLKLSLLGEGHYG